MPGRPSSFFEGHRLGPKIVACLHPSSNFLNRQTEKPINPESGSINTQTEAVLSRLNGKCQPQVAFSIVSALSAGRKARDLLCSTGFLMLACRQLLRSAHPV